MATITERKMNLFDVSDDYCLAHCISADCKLGAGIAVTFERKFHLRSQLNLAPRVFPSVVRTGKVFNLITKRYYYDKPTYSSMTTVLECLRSFIKEEHISKLAMPRIGCGLDRLQWKIVKTLIEEAFKDIDVEILVCCL
jgi:hypothetical protein